MNNSVDDSIRRIKQAVASQGRRIHPCLTESEVADFETRWHVRLPEGYRRFLKEVGNGGEGPPHYGLLRLGEVPGDYDRPALDVLKDVSKPFPLTTYWVWEGEEEAKLELHEAIEHGHLVLGTEGCAMYWLLIVTGPERGQIWNLADVGTQPCAPGRDFLGWYEDWLAGGRDWWSGFEASG